ncbi:MAG: hypothetical protein WDM92_12365 [Caulobacteraceae bacterium]
MAIGRVLAAAAALWLAGAAAADAAAALRLERVVLVGAPRRAAADRERGENSRRCRPGPAGVARRARRADPARGGRGAADGGRACAAPTPPRASPRPPAVRPRVRLDLGRRRGTSAPAPAATRWPRAWRRPAASRPATAPKARAIRCSAGRDADVCRADGAEAMRAVQAEAGPGGLRSPAADRALTRLQAIVAPDALSRRPRRLPLRP